jgi:hypothetical protein
LEREAHPPVRLKPLATNHPKEKANRDTMKINKQLLIEKITGYLQTKQAELLTAKKAEATDCKTKAAWELERVKWAKDCLVTAVKLNPVQVEVETSKHYGWGSSSRTTINIKGLDIPNRIDEEPATTCKESPDQIEKQILKAQEHKKLIEMAYGDSVEVNTKAVLDSIAPYLR